MAKPKEQNRAPKQKVAQKQAKLEGILFGLVEYFLKTGKAVGSETLRESGFADISSATIRNYFVELEEKGFVRQHHTSGGRVPTSSAFRLYAQHCQTGLEQGQFEAEGQHSEKTAHIRDEQTEDMKEVALFLQRRTEAISESTGCAAFLSSPRFDQDFVTEIKLVSVDHSRALAILLTSFGQIYTELLHAPHKISTLSLKRIEEYFQYRIKGQSFEPDLTDEELQMAVRFYQEAMTRYIVSYVNFTKEDMFRTGFSKLLRYPEFQEAESLTSSLSLFENQTALRALVRECIKSEKNKVWIAEDLFAFLTGQANCAVIAAPYTIGHKKVGAIGIIGPMRMPYKYVISQVMAAAEDISHFLEKNLYRHKISFRTPAHVGYEIGEASRKLLAAPVEKQLLQQKTKE